MKEVRCGEVVRVRVSERTVRRAQETEKSTAPSRITNHLCVSVSGLVGMGGCMWQER